MHFLKFNVFFHKVIQSLGFVVLKMIYYFFQIISWGEVVLNSIFV